MNKVALLKVICFFIIAVFISGAAVSYGSVTQVREGLSGDGVSAAGADKKAAEKTGYVNTKVTPLNVRTGPWGKKIGKLPRGSRVEIVGKDGDWYKISYNGATAYVHSYYITDKPVAAKKPSESKDDSADSQKNYKTTGGKVFPGSPMAGNIRIGSKYGMRMHPVYHVWKMHNGVDISAKTGTPLLAMGNGKVIASGWSGGAGYRVKIKYDNGYTSTYMHCKPEGALAVGAKVTTGQVVSKANNTGCSTGSHLHLEITNPGGARIDPKSVL